LRKFRKRGAFSDKAFLGNIDGVGIVGEVKSDIRWHDVELGGVRKQDGAAWKHLGNRLL